MKSILFILVTALTPFTVLADQPCPQGTYPFYETDLQGHQIIQCLRQAPGADPRCPGGTIAEVSPGVYSCQ